MEKKKEVPRILVCGTGVAGSAFAAILARRLGGNVALTVTERAERVRDQGYGLDLDVYGQLAMARAGLYDHYWSISKNRSDSMAMYPMKGPEAQFVYFRPNLLRKWLPSVFGAQPESNRGELRALFLRELETTYAATTKVAYEQGAFELKKAGNGVEAFEKGGKSLGIFDLVVDASGVHSPLRGYRVDDPEGKHLDFYMMIHGVVSNPEATVDPEFVRRLGTHGTLFVFGRGYFFFTQRFGPGDDDKRMALLYYVPTDSETKLFDDIGIDPTSSRRDGIMTDHRLEKVKEWIVKDMGDHFDPCYRDFVKHLDRVTIRPNVTHGLQTTFKKECDIPVVCIGDALLGCGIGGGGNLALKDAVELAELLEDPSAFEKTTGGGLVANLPHLRKKEAEWLKLKMDWLYAKETDLGPAVFTREPGVVELEWSHMWPNSPIKRFILSTIFKWFAALTCWWFKLDLKHGVANSHPASPHFPQVLKAAREAKNRTPPNVVLKKTN
ncbi:hypothetical protein CTAYLR_003202 [Chrysophaeum taylorii]|uniref:FAD-binding domain-containing protein n=1 Tax=Chrysophaeum taylorii TaxID=2483200 RepID=A0AAD7XJJ0_9STRA|nr:hypothetical protein CTAYLR_003202 [Chrysophaeum taylorii]